MSSVCLSATRVFCDEIAEVRLTRFSLCLAFKRGELDGKIRRGHLDWGLKLYLLYTSCYLPHGRGDLSLSGLHLAEAGTQFSEPQIDARLR